MAEVFGDIQKVSKIAVLENIENNAKRNIPKVILRREIALEGNIYLTNRLYYLFDSGYKFSDKYDHVSLSIFFPII